MDQEDNKVKEKNKTKEDQETHGQELVRRIKDAVYSQPKLTEAEEQNEILVIEDMRKGLRITLGSVTENIHSLFTLSKQIKKEFFNN